MHNFETEIRRDQPALPPIKITEDESRRLSSLANSTMDLFPRVAQFLARELERASVAAENDLRGVVRMGSKVTYRDDGTGASREIVLVYPHEANIELNRVSILTPVGAALIGLSVGQRIEFETPDKRTRGLTVLAVSE
ncbi:MULTISPECIES: nucleoside diphosphate kinase regulator [unclassified Bradyrhizobium]|uniref:nucleoside diphosphate kinase regulator n=1 Tax=unclassified Bradyrhizobium TaxID=2631580 RepID=UPI000382251B|nr:MULTISPECIES: nucleoside diphosphate kinase regulator [unclassified Bradyrhizobium]SFM43077.1 regulator of nucleoside diphosphate kinase [Bradyrhizobium sp. Rc3b]MBB4263524.1 regulator of nucleoside diphosphate kinase [Bradyrhizobium sp. CIR3A]MBB4361813.1 regulator of nucleoside diphosphate kinase [Bradyrhizobium sp. CIR18]MBB4378543.1 regulator of nucleoside diphosphate kinase [Bradyrhizobium sp. SBR1B]MBB4426703.1 regulator of nucleoside diphosphate kinase [Bradyrhizobium sp. CIR48]